MILESHESHGDVKRSTILGGTESGRHILYTNAHHSGTLGFLFLPGAETVETVSGDCLNTANLKDTSVHSLHPKATYEFT